MPAVARNGWPACAKLPPDGDALDKIRRNLIGANAVYPTPFGARRAANVLGERPERARPAALPEQVAAELVFFTT